MSKCIAIRVVKEVDPSARLFAQTDGRSGISSTGPRFKILARVRDAFVLGCSGLAEGASLVEFVVRFLLAALRALRPGPRHSLTPPSAPPDRLQTLRQQALINGYSTARPATLRPRAKGSLSSRRVRFLRRPGDRFERRRLLRMTHLTRGES